MDPSTAAIRRFSVTVDAPTPFGAESDEVWVSPGKKKDKKKKGGDDDGGGSEGGTFLPPIDWSAMPCNTVLGWSEDYWNRSQEYYQYAENARSAGATDAAAINEAFADAYAEESEEARAAYDAGDCIEEGT